MKFSGVYRNGSEVSSESLKGVEEEWETTKGEPQKFCLTSEVPPLLFLSIIAIAPDSGQSDR